MLGVIGGSGFEKFEEFETVNLLERETPFGLAASGFKKVRVDGVEFLFISRHGDHHEHLPSEINYRANIFALKKQGARAVISFSAVGSLQKEFAPGDLVVPFQYIDRTKSLRAHTFLGQGLIGHVSLAKPICEVMANRLRELIAGAESNSYRQMQADIIGMSNFPEYALAREAGLPYLPCCFVTDYDCWDDSIPHVTVDEVIKVMRKNNSKAFSVLKKVLKTKDIEIGSLAFEGGLKTGLFMPVESIPADKKSWVQFLMS